MTAQRKAKSTSESKSLKCQNPKVKAALEDFKKAHAEVLQVGCKMLFKAKEAGEILLRLEKLCGFKKHWHLFLWLELQPEENIGSKISKTTFYGYVNVAERWNEIAEKVGGKVSALGWTNAVKMLAKPKEDPKPPEGWEEKDGCYFKGDFCLKPDGAGHWRVVKGDKEQGGCDTLKVAAAKADELAYEVPPVDRRIVPHPAPAQDATLEQWEAVADGCWQWETYQIKDKGKGEPRFLLYANGKRIGNAASLDEAKGKVEAWDVGGEEEEQEEVLDADPCPDEPSGLPGLTRRDFEEIQGEDDPPPPEPEAPRPTHSFKGGHRFRVEDDRLTCLDGNGHVIIVATENALPAQLKEALALWEGK
jgi:hypothetical protein